MRIAFVIASLRSGGAERVATLLANAWREQGHTMSIVTFEVPGEQPAYRLNQNVELLQLGLAGTSKGAVGATLNNLNRIRSLRQCLYGLQPDVVVSFLTETNVVAIAAGRMAPWATLVSERIHPAYHQVFRPWDFLRRISYRRADAVVVQGDDIARWMRSNVGVEAPVVPNPVDLLEFFPEQSKVAPNLRKRLLAVGRLSEQKGFDILIQAFAAAAPSIPEWDLSIYGDGPLESELQAMIAGSGIGERISIHKTVADVAEVYRAADAFVHPARYEGYPNVVVEALASGLPVIASDSQEIVRELLANGRCGILYEAESVTSLTQALIETLPDRERCAVLANAAPEAVQANSVEAISVRWIELFHDAIKRRRGQSDA